MLPVFAALTACLLWLMGRHWWCACGAPWPWVSDVNGAHNSQHLFDPYTFTHFEHGLVFFWLFSRLPARWRWFAALALESGWEVLENTNWVIDRYRTQTASALYYGDTIANSVADLGAMALGYWFASRVPARASLIVFVAFEVALLASIQDSLVLNVLMLLVPSQALKEWQQGA